MSTAWPDPWSPASHAPQFHRHGTLLRLQAEMFVAARVRDREMIRTFEAMALGLMPRTDSEALVAAAQTLASCTDTPESVLAGLALHDEQARSVIAASAPRLPAPVVDSLLGAPSERALLAARHDLEDRILDRLLVLDDDPVNATLAANPALPPSHPALALLLRRAQERRALAAILLARGDLTLRDEAALYLQADRERQAAIRGRISGSALFQRPHAPPRLSSSEIADLLTEAQRGDVGAFETGLSAALALPVATPWRLLESGREDLLALALVGLGLGEDDAARIFLTLHPAIAHSVDVVFSLMRVVRDTSRPSALGLIEAILGARAGANPVGRHVPGSDHSGVPVRPGSPALNKARPPHEDKRALTVG